MLVDLINRIEELKSELESLIPMKDEDKKRLDKKIRLEFNYNSNHIEGNTLTYGETELLLYFGKSNGDHDKRELDEMEAHDVAFKLIKEWAEDKSRDLNEVDIKQLNEIILVKPFWKEAITSDGQNTSRSIKVGDYKEFPNSVRLQNGEVFEYATPIDTPIKMKELLEWYNSNKDLLHPIELASIFHHKFLLIHPFDDGNGRISRLLVNYILLKNGYPPIIIKSADKKNYLFALNKADAGMMDDFISYMAIQLVWSFELYIKAARGESIEEKNDWEKELELIAKKRKDAPTLRTDELTLIRIKDSVLPIFRKINILVADKFNNFFETLETKYDPQLFKNIISDINFENQQLKINIFSVSQPIITLHKSFIKFKKDHTNNFNLYLSLGIIFTDFDYRFYFTHEDKKYLITKRISDKLNDLEIENLISEFGKKVTSLIKENIEK